MKKLFLVTFSFFLLIGGFWNISRAQPTNLECEITRPSFTSLSLTRAQISKKIPVVSPIQPGNATFQGLDVLFLNDHFATINFDQDYATTGTYHIPANPSGACGADYLLDVVNNSIEWYDRAGNLQQRTSLSNFFSSLSPDTALFDPRVLYDLYEGRFIVVSLEKETFPTRSHLFVAVSATTNPGGSWYYLDIDAQEIIGGNTCWADFPGLAIDEEAIYITCNMFNYADEMKGVRLWIIDKGITDGFYAGANASYQKYDPYSEANVGSEAVTTTPAYMYEPHPENIGTYLVAYSNYHSVTTDYLLIFWITNPLSSPTFDAYWLSAGDFDDNDLSVPNAPQLGTGTTLSAGDKRILDAAWRNDFLYAVTTCVPNSGNDAGEATVHWFKINTSNTSTPSLTDQGDVGGEDITNDCYTFYPSLAINKQEQLGIGFCASAATIYPGAYYTGRMSTDPAGTVQPVEVMNAGDDYYIRKLGGTENRWGAYSSTSLDPRDGETFWVFNQYGMTRGTTLNGEDGRWATAFGSFAFKIYVDITIFMEGPYNGTDMNTNLNSQGKLPLSQPYDTDPWYYYGTESVTTMPANIVDWVLVELRTDVGSGSIYTTRAALLRNDGHIVDLDGNYLGFQDAPPGDYYIVVRHRNHLDIMSANAVSLDIDPTSYDFTTGSDKFYGTGIGIKELKTNVWGMVAGDANGNNYISNDDYSLYKASQGNEGYEGADFNMDTGVYAEDYSLFNENNNRESSVPD